MLFFDHFLETWAEIFRVVFWNIFHTKISFWDYLTFSQRFILFFYFVVLSNACVIRFLCAVTIFSSSYLTSLWSVFQVNKFQRAFFWNLILNSTPQYWCVELLEYNLSNSLKLCCIWKIRKKNVDILPRF